MRPLRLSAALLCLLATADCFAADDPMPGPDSKPQDGVPKGEVLQFTFENSKIFPGTFRDYWVYIPAQYKADKPACLYVNQDRIQFEAPTVFDNLIHKGEMPVTIGVFVTHGRVRAADENAALDRFNRSYEYDGLGDNYARFLIEELLPDVETKTASDGRAIRLSKDPNDRAIGGSSSGAVCAFTVAWERPDSFRRVFSSVGTFVGLRGADRYHTLVRKYEPKPIRIYLQDGSNDLNIYAGDWWMANQTMARALEFAGYDVTHVWGEGGHNGKHATAIFPDAMRWLWRDYPQPITPGKSKNDFYEAIVDPDQGWELVAEGSRFTAKGLTANAAGEVFFIDWPNGKSYRIDLSGKVNEFLPDLRQSLDQAIGPDGRLYVASGASRIVAYDEQRQARDVATGFRGQDLVVAHNGNIYVTERSSTPFSSDGKLWLVRPDGSKQVVDEKINPAGVTLSPDQSLLYLARRQSHWVDSYAIQEDGTLAHKQRYFWLHESDTIGAGPEGLCVDRDGRLYVATRLGVQICDQPGRVHLILPMPHDESKKAWEHASSLCFGGEKFDILYVSCGDKIYKRKLKVRGANAWEGPHKPEKPRL